MPFYKLPTVGNKEQFSPPPEQVSVSSPAAARVPGGEPVRRTALFPVRLVPGLVRLLLRAAAVRAAASGRLVDEQEERQLRLLRNSAPASGPGR
ncbi:hypothetical protein ACWGQ2_09950 [Arthrobacter sp. NPDC055585]